MLQQTRVEAVKGYYARFLAELPTISSLAQCDDDVLHKLWEGLGYYSRVRNLKKAAIQIVEQYNKEAINELKKIIETKDRQEEIIQDWKNVVTKHETGEKWYLLSDKTKNLFNDIKNHDQELEIEQTRDRG